MSDYLLLLFYCCFLSTHFTLTHFLPSLLSPRSPSLPSQFTIETDDLDLAGDIIQSLASYLGLEDVAVTASFPQQMEELQLILEKVYIREGIYSRCLPC